YRSFEYLAGVVTQSLTLEKIVRVNILTFGKISLCRVSAVIGRRANLLKRDINALKENVAGTFIKNKICRSSQGSCDYPDRCDGKSNTGYCFNGNCLNRDYMCKLAYNEVLKYIESAYYSKDCALHLADIIKFKCPRPTKHQPFDDLVSNENLSKRNI
ncbi:hypothetical protein MXB_4673, partial [Myxobolus squamalis]